MITDYAGDGERSTLTIDASLTMPLGQPFRNAEEVRLAHCDRQIDATTSCAKGGR